MNAYARVSFECQCLSDMSFQCYYFQRLEHDKVGVRAAVS